ncbi:MULTISPECIES: glycosyltransferase [unclassified Vibrio]|uniref:glycosyltransferase n=1 Tax=unclassified Vibrio TaxID=2614977 RepID=UPI000B8EAFC3|nr:MULTISPECIES: glycosyltransferase [unclassified Vibrio]NAW98844.1 glycosyltransferase [Vibrio sp. V23_P3S9T160]OXX48127.1 glycosyl transferase [Vibrio sp. V11_P1A41T118]PRQ61365.1 glycosyl transferase [Vibrio sp. V01_P9A10T6]
MDNFPKVSVITFAYVSESNGRYPLLRECIESIRDQRYPNYEHIIIDDGSDKELAHLAEEYPNVKYFKKPGTGIIASTYTFNLGHELATGKYCIYLPSDDLHVEYAIIKLVEALEKDPDASMAIGKAIYEYIDGRITIWSPDKDKIENRLYEGNYVNGCAVMWKRSDSLYDCLPPNYTGFCCDYDLWATIAKLGKIVYPDSDVVKYRHVSDSTRNKTRSSFIVSPRKEDKGFYQYSKESRIEFVKLRCHQSLNRLTSKNQSETRLENVKRVSLTADFPLAMAKHLKKRNWEVLDNYFEKHNSSYLELKKELKNYKGNILFEDINISTCCLIRQLPENESIYISSEFSRDGWIVDYLPLPNVQGVVEENGQVNQQLSSFIGL